MLVSLPTSGTLYLENEEVIAGQFISVADIAAGKLKFVASSAGSPTFTFKVQNDGGTDNGGLDLDPIARTMTFEVYEM